MTPRPIRTVGTAEEALSVLGVMLGWNGGLLPLFIDDGVGKPVRRYRECGAGLACWLGEQVRAQDGRLSRDVSIALPETSRGAYGPSWATVLWAWVQGKDQVARAARFSPAPSMVLRVDGSSRRLLLWWLAESLAYGQVGPANRRLAYALHAPQKWAMPESLRIPLPGSFIRVGRARPAAVLTTRMEDVQFSLGQLVGGLKVPPDPNAWRERR